MHCQDVVAHTQGQIDGIVHHMLGHVAVAGDGQDERGLLWTFAQAGVSRVGGCWRVRKRNRRGSGHGVSLYGRLRFPVPWNINLRASGMFDVNCLI